MTSDPKLSDGELDAIRALADAGGNTNWVTAPATARHSRDLGRELNGPTVYRRLSRLPRFVEYRTTGGTRRFHLKQAARSLFQEGASRRDQPTFIKPGTPWSTQRELRRYLGENSEGSLLLIDPYVSEETLDVLADVSVPIRILTSTAGRKGKEEEFMRALSKFKKEKNGLVELRLIQASRLHGRYIFTAEQGWVIDHSLQDLGTKPALVIPLRLEAAFGDALTHFVALFQSGEPIAHRPMSQ